jgi:hypothetical protein
VTVTEALEWVRRNGVVLESATGPVPALATAIAGSPIRGSWWAHPRAREIFALTRVARDCPEVLVCRIVGGKVTYVHRRLWPALVRVADAFPKRRLARIRETHTAAGRHVTTEVPFPRWVTAALAAEAGALDAPTALAALGAWCRP